MKPEILLPLVAGLSVLWLCSLLVRGLARKPRVQQRPRLMRAIEYIRALALKQITWNWRHRIEKRLLHAGLWHWQVADLVILYAALAFLSAIMTLVWTHSLAAMLLAALVMLSTIELWIRQRKHRYSLKIARHLPAFLDLLCLSLGAGMSFNAALVVVLRYSSDGPLRVLWRDWLFDVRAGYTRIDALNRLRQKSTQLSLQRLCVAMIQAEKSGAALAATLKLQAKQLRQDQILAAEKRAAQAPMRMLLPLIVCFFPSTFLVLAFSIWVGVGDAL